LARDAKSWYNVAMEYHAKMLKIGSVIFAGAALMASAVSVGAFAAGKDAAAKNEMPLAGVRVGFALKCATKRVEFLSASCYKRMKESKTYVQKALPAVFHSEWRTPDGREAAVLANWTKEKQTYTLDFGGGKTVSGVLSPREWRLVPIEHGLQMTDFSRK